MCKREEKFKVILLFPTNVHFRGSGKKKKNVHTFLFPLLTEEQEENTILSSRFSHLQIFFILFNHQSLVNQEQCIFALPEFILTSITRRVSVFAIYLDREPHSGEMTRKLSFKKINYISHNFLPFFLAQNDALSKKNV
jgi:hypothetical protein